MATTEQLMSKVNIEVVGVDLANGEESFFLSVMQRAAANAINAKSVTVYCAERVPADAPEYKHPGWIEYTMRIEYKHGGVLTIGAIQRTKGAEVEFHS